MQPGMTANAAVGEGGGGGRFETRVQAGGKGTGMSVVVLAGRRARPIIDQPAARCAHRVDAAPPDDLTFGNGSDMVMRQASACLLGTAYSYQALHQGI